MFFLFSSCKKIRVCYYALAMIGQVHLFDKTSNQTIYKGIGTIDTLKNDGCRVQFQNDTHHFTWNIYESGLVIRSESEIVVNLTLRPQRKTKGHIETTFGIIDCECETTFYQKNLNHVEIQYILIQGNEKQKFHFILSINKEGNYAIH